MWFISPEQNAYFITKMEDVLGVYILPYDENCPVICIDEKPYKLLDEYRDSSPMSTGKQNVSIMNMSATEPVRFLLCVSRSRVSITLMHVNAEPPSILLIK